MARETNNLAKLREKGNDEPIVSLRYQCSTIHQVMKNLLLSRGLLTKHHKYEFSIREGSHHVSEVFCPYSISGRPGF